MNETEEKMDEKELQKHEEKSAEEKSYEEKYRRDPLGTMVWAAILIWAGIVLLANNIGFLDRFAIRVSDLPIGIPFAAEAWSLIFIGAGVILLIEVLIRSVVPDYRRPVMGTFILAIVFFGIGLDNWDLIWPFILIAIGTTILLRGLFKK
jgi:hypothetical protein